MSAYSAVNHLVSPALAMDGLVTPVSITLKTGKKVWSPKNRSLQLPKSHEKHTGFVWYDNGTELHERLQGRLPVKIRHR